MNNVIDFQKYKIKKGMTDRSPCEKCPNREECKNTCKDAEIWFDLLAERLKGKC